jgi:hypothetical protein
MRYAVHIRKHIAHGQLNGNTIGLFQLHGILQAPGSLCKKLFGALAGIRFREWLCCHYVLLPSIEIYDKQSLFYPPSQKAADFSRLGSTARN